MLQNSKTRGAKFEGLRQGICIGEASGQRGGWLVVAWSCVGKGVRAASPL